jgi:HEAT repeat protein
MPRALACLPVAALLALAFAGCAEPATPTPPAPEPEPKVDVSEQRVRWLLGGEKDWEAIAYLIGLGESAFPAYEAILADTDPRNCFYFSNVSIIISRLQTDRRRFVPVVLRRMSDPGDWAHHVAAILLGNIGDGRDAAALVPVLSDGREETRYAAAEALAKIGGRPELDAWLKDGRHLRSDNERQLFQKLRDELEARVKANPVPRDHTN